MKYFMLIVFLLNVPFFIYGAAHVQDAPGGPTVPLGVSRQQNWRQITIEEALAAYKPRSLIPAASEALAAQRSPVWENQRPFPRFIAQAGREHDMSNLPIDTAAPVAGSKRTHAQRDAIDNQDGGASVLDIETSEDQDYYEKGASHASSPLSVGADSVSVSSGIGSQSVGADSVSVSSGIGKQFDEITDDEEDYIQKMGLGYAEEEYIRLQLAALSPSPTAKSLAVIDKMILAYPCVEAIPSIILNKYYPGGMELYAKGRLRYPKVHLTFSATELPYRTLMNKVNKLRKNYGHLNVLNLFPEQAVWRNRAFIAEANEYIARSQAGLKPREIRWHTIGEDSIPHFGWAVQEYAQDGESCRMCDAPAVYMLSHHVGLVKTAHACGDCARIMETPGNTLLEMVLKSKATACPSLKSTEITDNILDLPDDDEFVDPRILALKYALEDWLAAEYIESLER